MKNVTYKDVSKVLFADGPPFFVLIVSHVAALAALLTSQILVLALQTWLALQRCPRILHRACMRIHEGGKTKLKNTKNVPKQGTQPRTIATSFQ